MALGPQEGLVSSVGSPFSHQQAEEGEKVEKEDLLLLCELIPHPADLPSRLFGDIRKQ